MKKYSSSNKLRQLKVLSTRVSFLLKDQSIEATLQINKLKSLISRLINDLKFSFPKRELIKALGSAAIIFGLSISNQASAQWFEAPVTNAFGLDSTLEFAMPEFTDLDNDGDLDLLVGEYYGSLKYFENTGSASEAEFDAPITNPFGIAAPYYLAFPSFADLDNDGDFDLMIGEYYGTLQYYENTGSATSPAFAVPVSNPFELIAPHNFAAIEFVDLDNDGDFDLFLGDYDIVQNGYYDYQAPLFQYYENTGTASSPEFASPLENPFGLEEPNAIPFPSFADLDNDGDQDMIVGNTSYGYYYSEGNLQYYENTGTAESPEFAAPVNLPFGLASTYYIAIPDFADLDNDGDFDLLVGEYYGAMKYFENTGAVGIEDVIGSAQLSIYPNPVIDLLNIQSDIEIERVQVVDIVGKTIMDFTNPPSQISFSELNSGMYVINISLANGEQLIKKVLKD